MRLGYDVSWHAELGVLPFVRRGLRKWLDQLGCDAQDAALLVVAANEAVTNSIEHAYIAGQRGKVHVRVEVCSGGGAPEERHVSIAVSDQGHWRIPREACGAEARGIAFMRAVANTAVETTESGTRVTLTAHRAQGPDSKW
jgi:anti-sigma regulatory factor (Ser/Thr protein kinase)